MNIKNFIIGAAAGAVLLGAMTIPAFAATSALGNNWRVVNGMPGTAKFWDINKPKSDSNGGFIFPILQLDTRSSGSFVIYMLNNYNIDMTGKTITVNMNWNFGTYETRSSYQGAYVRLEFQDVTSGPYNSDDYWWSTGTTNSNLALDLNGVTTGTLTAALKDCSLWTNMDGMSACDPTMDNWYPGSKDEWGNVMTETPAKGFARAVKNVKQVGLSFGNESKYASGVALTGESGLFDMTSFTIE